MTKGNATYLSLPHLNRRMILQPMLKVSVSDASVHGSNTSIGLSLTGWEPRLQTAPPNSSRTSSLEKSASMSMTISSTHTSSLKAPLPLADLRRKVAPLEIVWDLEETLAVSI